MAARPRKSLVGKWRGGPRGNIVTIETMGHETTGWFKTGAKPEDETWKQWGQFVGRLVDGGTAFRGYYTNPPSVTAAHRLSCTFIMRLASDDDDKWVCEYRTKDGGSGKWEARRLGSRRAKGSKLSLEPVCKDRTIFDRLAGSAARPHDARWAETARREVLSESLRRYESVGMGMEGPFLAPGDPYVTRPLTATFRQSTKSTDGRPPIRVGGKPRPPPEAEHLPDPYLTKADLGRKLFQERERSAVKLKESRRDFRPSSASTARVGTDLYLSSLSEASGLSGKKLAAVARRAKEERDKVGRARRGKLAGKDATDDKAPAFITQTTKGPLHTQRIISLVGVDRPTTAPAGGRGGRGRRKKKKGGDGGGGDDESEKPIFISGTVRGPLNTTKVLSLAESATGAVVRSPRSSSTSPKRPVSAKSARGQQGGSGEGDDDDIPRFLPSGTVHSAGATGLDTGFHPPDIPSVPEEDPVERLRRKKAEAEAKKDKPVFRPSSPARSRMIRSVANHPSNLYKQKKRRRRRGKKKQEEAPSGTSESASISKPALKSAREQLVGLLGSGFVDAAVGELRRRGLTVSDDELLAAINTMWDIDDLRYDNVNDIATFIARSRKVSTSGFTGPAGSAGSASKRTVEERKRDGSESTHGRELRGAKEAPPSSSGATRRARGGGGGETESMGGGSGSGRDEGPATRGRTGGGEGGEGEGGGGGGGSGGVEEEEEEEVVDVDEVRSRLERAAGLPAFGDVLSSLTVWKRSAGAKAVDILFTCNAIPLVVGTFLKQVRDDEATGALSRAFRSWVVPSGTHAESGATWAAAGAVCDTIAAHLERVAQSLGDLRSSGVGGAALDAVAVAVGEHVRSELSAFRNQASAVGDLETKAAAADARILAARERLAEADKFREAALKAGSAVAGASATTSKPSHLRYLVGRRGALVDAVDAYAQRCVALAGAAPVSPSIDAHASGALSTALDRLVSESGGPMDAEAEAEFQRVQAQVDTLESEFEAALAPLREEEAEITSEQARLLRRRDELRRELEQVKGELHEVNTRRDKVRDSMNGVGLRFRSRLDELLAQREGQAQRVRARQAGPRVRAQVEQLAEAVAQASKEAASGTVAAVLETMRPSRTRYFETALAWAATEAGVLAALEERRATALAKAEKARTEAATYAKIQLDTVVAELEEQRAVAQQSADEDAAVLHQIRSKASGTLATLVRIIERSSSSAPLGADEVRTLYHIADTLSTVQIDTTSLEALLPSRPSPSLPPATASSTAASSAVTATSSSTSESSTSEPASRPPTLAPSSDAPADPPMSTTSTTTAPPPPSSVPTRAPAPAPTATLPPSRAKSGWGKAATAAAVPVISMDEARSMAASSTTVSGDGEGAREEEKEEED